MFGGWKDIKSKTLNEVSKGNWATGKDGKFDGVPRQYLGAKPDKCLEAKQKSPWQD